MRIAAIERHLRDLLIRDHLTDSRRAAFDQSGICLDFDLFGSLTNLKNNVDDWTAINLKNDAGLHVGPEAG